MRSAPLALLLALSGCDFLASTARPDAPTATDAMGEEGASCDETAEYAEPLIVDLSSSQRGDLELAMREGVVVVQYGCEGLKMLPDCRVDGEYGFLGYETKEDVISINDQSELGANLPVEAGAIGAKLEGEFERGKSLEIALAMIGARRTTTAQASRGDLVEARSGACKDATHFVRGATLGAFAMATGEKAAVRGAAEIFGIPQLGDVGASGSGSSEKSVGRKDGDLPACKAADPYADDPPRGCASLLRLNLTKVDDEGAPMGASPVPASEIAVDCPGDMVFAEGKCTPPSDEIAHQCQPQDQDDCTTQCERGNVSSCVLAGNNFVNSHDGAAALDYYEKACDQDSPEGCGGVAAAYALGDGAPLDPKKAASFAAKACDLGGGDFCGMLALFYLTGNQIPQDDTKAAVFAKRGCAGGSTTGCAVLGNLYRKGKGGLPKDPVAARKHFKRSCDGRNSLGCVSYAVMLEEGIGGEKDVARAKELFELVCASNTNPQACEWAKR